MRDLFFNTPARKKFLKAESTELSHIASLVTHYALAHPEKHWELHTSTHAMLVAAPVAAHADRIYQIFGKETLEQLLPLAATVASGAHPGLPQPPRVRRKRDEESSSPSPGDLRLHGFVSKPEMQKLNRNSIFIFVNGRLVRDRLIQHALTEAYRNIIPPTVFPVVLLFLEMPFAEVDVNVHPSKTEVRFRQQTLVHDFVRDSVRAALMRARPAPQFMREIHAQPTAAAGSHPGAGFAFLARGGARAPSDPGERACRRGAVLAGRARLPFAERGACSSAAASPWKRNAAVPAARFGPQGFGSQIAAAGAGRQRRVSARARSAASAGRCSSLPEEAHDLSALSSLQPLGQIRDSFILAVNPQGSGSSTSTWPTSACFSRSCCAARLEARVESQRLLMPLIVELTPGQLAVFAEIADELERNGFEAEPFGSRTLAVKTAPSGIDAGDVERMLHELLEQLESEQQAINLEKVRTRIAASIACHAAIKINTPLDTAKMEWLLRELARHALSHELSARPAGRAALFREGHSEGVQADLRFRTI